MSKYDTLISILDHIRTESSPTTFSSLYLPDASQDERVNQARARALIHLYLKVSFGILDFAEREAIVTDGSFDGGVDAYHIDRENRVVHFVQSKFRINESNFITRSISLSDLLVMDINRMLDGESRDEKGNPYNQKIVAMQKSISSIDDIGRYKYKVVILANAPDITDSKIRQLTGGLSTEVINYERTFNDLVFPIISGTFFRATDLHIYIDMSNKNAGAKISYEVSTTHYDSEITALFVPTIEIARVMQKYKNSILLYNPRSYLELDGHKVNTSIRETIQDTKTNEFALFNNGITMLSDETYINEKIGQRNKAQLILKNPQIINGGQTAFTLSRILDETPIQLVEQVFGGKEVLLKIITLIQKPDGKGTPEQRMDLIDKISTASNQQTPVVTADKFSNNQDHIKIQRVLFDRYGILYERKRGEFADGLNSGYISPDLLLERNLFFRLYYAVIGQVRMATRKKLFLNMQDPLITIKDGAILDKLYYAMLCYKKLIRGGETANRSARTEGLYARLYALSEFRPEKLEDYGQSVEGSTEDLKEDWNQLIKLVAQKRPELCRESVDGKTGEQITIFNQHTWIGQQLFKADIAQFFRRNPGSAELSKSRILVTRGDGFGEH